MKKHIYIPTTAEKLSNYLEENKERWALGLCYMADKEFRKPYEVSEAHLNIILNDIKHHLEQFYG